MTLELTVTTCETCSNLLRISVLYQVLATVHIYPDLYVSLLLNIIIKKIRTVYSEQFIQILLMWGSTLVRCPSRNIYNSNKGISCCTYYRSKINNKNQSTNDQKATYWLVWFSTTLITCVSCNFYHRFNFSRTCNNSSYNSQFTNGVRFDSTYWFRLLGT